MPVLRPEILHPPTPPITIRLNRGCCACRMSGFNCTCIPNCRCFHLVNVSGLACIDGWSYRLFTDVVPGHYFVNCLNRPSLCGFGPAADFVNIDLQCSGAGSGGGAIDDWTIAFTFGSTTSSLCLTSGTIMIAPGQITWTLVSAVCVPFSIIFQGTVTAGVYAGAVFRLVIDSKCIDQCCCSLTGVPPCIDWTLLDNNLAACGYPGDAALLPASATLVTGPYTGPLAPPADPVSFWQYCPAPDVDGHATVVMISATCNANLTGFGFEVRFGDVNYAGGPCENAILLSPVREFNLDTLRVPPDPFTATCVPPYFDTTSRRPFTSCYIRGVLTEDPACPFP